MGHGSGGRLMHGLIEEHLGPAFGIIEYGDSALLDFPGTRLAFTTDSYVVSPIFFPGGNIGDIAVCGTVNDLAVSGARPLYLSAGFIIEEGFPLADLKTIVKTMAYTADRAGVMIVAGDTKVVNRGKGDGIFINTSGVGVLADGVNLSPKNIRAGDMIIVSGPIGRHGAAVMAERNGIKFNPPVLSDTAPLNRLTETIKASAGDSLRFMRDPTRGGLATTLKEAANESGLCMKITEGLIPIDPQVLGAAELLGIDPLYSANEGTLIAIVAKDKADETVAVMRTIAEGMGAVIIGSAQEGPASKVLMETMIGGTRIIEMLEGEQLPRIC